MKVLFVVPPLAGHINPTVAVAAELAARGHRVAWTGPAEVLPRLLPAGAALFPSGDRAGPAGYGSLHAHWRDLRGVGALRFLWEEALIPLARAMLPGVEAAVDAYAPDLLVVDQQALAGAVIAQRRGLPWVTSATTSAEFTRPFAGFPRVGSGWRTGSPDCSPTPAHRAAGTRASRTALSWSSPRSNWWVRTSRTRGTTPLWAPR